MPFIANQDITPAFYKIIIPEEYQRPAQGQVIPITAYIVETVTHSNNPRLMNLFTPFSDGPFITIYRPDDTITVDQALMLKVDKGTYQYIYTTALQPPGVYSAVFRAFGLNIHQLLTKRIYLFTLQHTP